MDFLTIHESPEAKLETLLIAFSGWADAAEGATSALKFLQRRLQTKKFAELDPEEFYDFSQTRPYTSRTRDGRRRIHWPANEFFYSTSRGAGAEPTQSATEKPATGDPGIVETGTGDTGMMLFMGVEPNLRWRSFSRTIAEVARDHGVKTVVHVGALLDAVPHTRAVRLSGTASRDDLKEFLENSGIKSSNYQGPTGISSAVMEACTNEGLGYASIWGHTSHYLQAAPNHRVSYTLLQTLIRLLKLPLDLSEIKSAAATFDEEVAKAVAKDEQINSYVAKLEGQYDDAVGANEIPDPGEVVRDLEQFLRGEQRHRPGEEAD